MGRKAAEVLPLTPAVREPEGGGKGADGNSNSWRIKKATRTTDPGERSRNGQGDTKKGVCRSHNAFKE